MRMYPSLICLTMTGCMPIDPGITKDIDDLVTNQVVRVEIDKNAIQKDTDIEINVKITNKDAPAEAPIINVHPQ